MKKMLSYGRQLLTQSDMNAVRKVLKSDILTQGEAILKFESALAKYCGAKYAVVVSSGTAALHIAYLALGLKDGDELITTPITFAATSNAALYCGASVKFADIDKKNALIDLDEVKKLINKKTKIIAPVHYAGNVIDMEALWKLAKENNIFIVEDACHALGSSINGVRTGSCKYSDMAILSFHPVKHITTGEGGAILTNDCELYKKLLMLRSHGITRENFTNEPTSPCYHEMQLLGYNYRMTDFQAALGISQLKKLDKFVQKRREIAKYYDAKFSGIKNITLLETSDEVYHSYHLYPILFENRQKRDEAYKSLAELNIKTQIHYMPVYLHPYYKNNGYDKVKCENAEDFYSRTLSIPIYPKLSEQEIKYVAKCIVKIAEELR